MIINMTTVHAAAAHPQLYRRGQTYVSSTGHGGRFLITISLCFVAYLLTKPSSLNTTTNDGELSFQQVKRAEREQESHGMVSQSLYGGLGFWLKEGLKDEFTPRIIWLLAWPSSGQEYILNTVERVSNHSTASNYGEQVTLPAYTSISIYPRYPQGPFWEGLGRQFGSKTRKLPQEYVLTLSQCSSICLECPPEDYYGQSMRDFEDACRKTSARVANSQDLVFSQYASGYQQVTRAIHVIRNPFHNVIQRFLQAREDHKEDAKFLEEYPFLPKKGFQKWCYMMDSRYNDKSAYSKQDWKLAKNALCHAEFYKYVQWHNHVFSISSEGRTSMVIYYEDFYTKSEETIDAILEFCHLPKTNGKPYEFPSPHDYSRYYTDEMRASIAAFVKSIASKVTWKHLQHYFEAESN